MGASNSKQEPVVVYGNEVPIGFTPQLSDRLVKEATAAQGGAKADKRSDKTSDESSAGSRAEVNSRDLADQVEKQVASELSRILEKSQLEDLRSKERQTSTAELLSEIRDITQQISSSPSAKSQTYAKSLQARDHAVSCLRENSGRALDCWKEVQEFKTLVSDLEREFVAASK
ncbi:hypothetical protein GQ54DRAFT_299200 [Martensiomyces pterosporus]|nr:hypothetical protein GQ54DRAFT_299200 [Martensiomyces pterosporus]